MALKMVRRAVGVYNAKRPHNSLQKRTPDSVHPMSNVPYQSYRKNKEIILKFELNKLLFLSTYFRTLHLKYHAEVKSGKNSNSIHKYSESLVPVIKRMLNRENFKKTCVDEYRIANPTNRKKTK